METATFSRISAALSGQPRSALRQLIVGAYRLPEPQCLPPLLAAAHVDPDTQQRVRALASRLVSGLRAERSRSSGVDALMKEFSLSSQEGVALMCLAEALLRVPDKSTADRLIRDKLAHGDWRAHVGNSPSLFVNAATWGLLVTGRLVATRSDEGLSSALTRMLARGGEPLIRKGMDLAMRMLGEQFVTGRDIDEALARGRGPESRGFRYSFDMLGEAAMTRSDAQRYYRAYDRAIHAIGKHSAGRGVLDGNGISIKLSALHPRYVWSQPDCVMDELLPSVKALCALARSYDIGLNIDAEEADRLDLSLDLLEALALDQDLAGWSGLGFVVQAYQKRAPFVLDYIIDLAARSGQRMMVRLVKGAYWDAEIKRAQVDGLADYPVFTRKVHTDVSYLACAAKLLAARNRIYPQFATHNAHTLAAIMHMAGDEYQQGDYEFQCLHGMGEPLYDQIVSSPTRARRVRIYAPVGSHETLLAYLVRRLLENGANSSFVNRIVDERVLIDELIADPVEEARRLAGAPHPRIPLPGALFGAVRRNSGGFDLSSEPVREAIATALSVSCTRRFEAGPIVAGWVQSADVSGNRHPVLNPADHGDQVGWVIEAEPAEIEQALVHATEAADTWACRLPSERAECLVRVADLMEQDGTQLIALLVREAGKSWANAVSELREAVDFCRYYAQEVRQFDNGTHQPLGPVVCISPWNFPLAIFTGQIAAALAAGNPVISKPAEQTPLIAAVAVKLFHAAGVPVAALQLLPGRGETVGASLVADPRVCGVMFTGSSVVANRINRVLAARGLVPLIAETGGQNAMIVDSTALPEQVVADVISSSFDSAGQRCSALRVLCLQEDIAAPVLEMLAGALWELRIGNTVDVRNDIGPVIDQEALLGLENHVAAMREAGARVTRVPVDAACSKGTFVAPTVIEIKRFSEVSEEQFGPILHVLRYKASELDHLVAEINASGYGLTLGVHSRIDESIEQVAALAHVGNLYVNRNMIGAVVGVQPFGGEGRSGTGPKAGGPLYLHRLLKRTPGPVLGQSERLGDSAEFAAFLEWLDHGARAFIEGDDLASLRARADLYRERRLAGLKLGLPGPTGEDNSLRFVARGKIFGIAKELVAYAHQLLAALASGNRIVFDDSKGARMLFESLPDGAQAWVSLDANGWQNGFDALLFDGPDSEAQVWQQRLAECEGPILPLLTPRPEYDISRLVHERTLSINTTAAGGNASLMTMGA